MILLRQVIQMGITMSKFDNVELREPTPLQESLWVGLMEARYTREDLLGILDDLMDSLSDDFFIMHYKTNETNNTLHRTKKEVDTK